MADTLDLPVIDLDVILKRDDSDASKAAVEAEAKKAADALYNYGILIVRDPRANEKDNDTFIDMIERYFEQPEETKMKDVRKEYYYQVGATPNFTELPRNHCERMKGYDDANKPLSLCPPEKDAKWRYFWRIGERPAATKFAQLNAADVEPEGFPEWRGVMNTWGDKLLAAGMAVAELAALGFGLPADTFSSRMNCGPHLLAPTASDLYRFGAKGTILAGYHYDLNFLTIHGKSRFPGLYVWTRTGVKKTVKIPAGCLLVQAGKQAEYITGGHVLAGFHEVLVTDDTLAAVEKAKAASKSCWRISSTLFSHIASDVLLEPIAHFGADPAIKAAYPPIYTGDHVAAELAAINLGEGSDGAGGGAGGGAATAAQ